MNEAHDPLETELQALQPREPSPELRQRIADRLTLAAPLRSRRRWRRVVWGTALAGGLAAACVVVAILLRGDRDVVSEPEPAVEPLQPLLASAFDDSLPTVWTYRRALARSPGQLDAVLDRHSGAVPEPTSQFAHVRAFTRFDGPDALPGEL